MAIKKSPSHSAQSKVKELFSSPTTYDNKKCMPKDKRVNTHKKSPNLFKGVSLVNSMAKAQPTKKMMAKE